jgi:hypothetical protein
MSDEAPIPKNEDTRPRDLIREQAASTASKDPLTALAAEQERPPIVEAPPPFPSMPSLPFQPPVTDDLMAEAARMAVADALKRITINGAPATPSGDGGFDFSIQHREPASETFARINSPPPPAPPTQTLSEQHGTLLGGVVEQPKPVEERMSLSEQHGTLLTGTKEQPPTFSTPQEPLRFPEHQEPYKGPLEQQHGSLLGRNESTDPHKDERGTMMGRERLEGETRGEYMERQKEIREFKKDDATAAAIKNGDTTYFNKGFVPVLFTRGDGLRKILLRIDNSISTVVEGAVGSERTGTLPATNGYYIAGADAPPHPWQVTFRKDGETWQYKVDLASDLYKGFADWTKQTVTGLDAWASASEGYLVLTGTIASGAITAAAVSLGGTTLPARITFAGSPSVQTQFVYQLAYIYAVGDGFKVIQNAHSHLTLVDVCVDGKGALYPIQ